MVKKELTIPLVKQYYYEVPSKSKDEVTFDIKDYGEASMSDYFKVLNIICKVEEWKPSRLIQ